LYVLTRSLVYRQTVKIHARCIVKGEIH